ncbi:endonuclease/exonuclease/phosphatase family protein [bacterium]|nr:endonuclease/exonuclease/phosphatase family protein [bacterium]
MKKIIITILICFTSTFIIAETNILNSKKFASTMKSSNIVIKVMSYNVLEGAYPAGPPSYNGSCKAYSNKDRSKEIINFVKSKDPDILLLQECNHWADNNNKRLKRFSKELDMPYAEIAPNHGHYNVALLSKYPIKGYTYFDDDVYYYWNIITANIQLTPACSIDVASSHFGWWGMPGYSKMTEEQKKQTYIKQKDTLMKYLQKHLNGNLIIGGDWNHGATQSPFGQGNLHDAIADLGYGKNLLHLFHPKENPIDNIYTSQSGRFSILNCTRFPAAKDFSDHLPVMAKISVTTD